MFIDYFFSNLLGSKKYKDIINAGKTCEKSIPESNIDNKRDVDSILMSLNSLIEDAKKKPYSEYLIHLVDAYCAVKKARRQLQLIQQQTAEN